MRSESVASAATPMKFHIVGLPSVPSVKVARLRMARIMIVIVFISLRVLSGSG